MTATPSRSRPTSTTEAAHGRSAAATLAWLQGRTDAMVELLAALARAESPSVEPAAQCEAFELLARALEGVGFRVRRVPGRGVGGRHWLCAQLVRVVG